MAASRPRVALAVEPRLVREALGRALVAAGIDVVDIVDDPDGPATDLVVSSTTSGSGLECHPVADPARAGADQDPVTVIDLTDLVSHIEHWGDRRRVDPDG